MSQIYDTAPRPSTDNRYARVAPICRGLTTADPLCLEWRRPGALVRSTGLLRSSTAPTAEILNEQYRQIPRRASDRALYRRARRHTLTRCDGGRHRAEPVAAQPLPPGHL